MLDNMQGVGEFTAAVPADFFRPVAGNYGWFFLAGWVMIHFFMIGAEWAFVQRFLAVKSQHDARKSAYLFGVMYLLTPLFWLLPPLLFRGQVQGVDKEQAYILAASSVLPPGMTGLLAAALFSATASMVSSQLNVFAGVFTNDFYRAKFSPGASDRRLVIVGRVCTAVLGALLIGAAILVPRLGGAEKLIVTINSMLVVPLYAPTLWGLFSKRITIGDMLRVALVSFFVGLLLRFGIATNPWITDESTFWSLANYLRENVKNVEVMVGVVLPVVMLGMIEWWKRTISPNEYDSRATNLKQRFDADGNAGHPHASEGKSSDTRHDEKFDTFPGLLVTGNVYAIGGWISFLAIIHANHRAILLAFGIALLLSAAVMHVAVRALARKNHVVGDHRV